MQEASRLGATQVVVVDTETGISHTAPLSALWQKGICIQRGHGEQVALPLTLWRREDPCKGRCSDPFYRVPKLQFRAVTAVSFAPLQVFPRHGGHFTSVDGAGAC